MSSNLTLITHINLNRYIDRAPCFASINTQTDKNFNHKVIYLDCKSNDDFIRKRHKSIKSCYGFFAFVDDDDFIRDDTVCWLNKAISKYPDAGMVYSNERHQMGEYGIIDAKASNEYEGLLWSATRLHHICAINSKYITDKSLELALKAQCGIEWCMKAEAALQYGAVYINEYLYTYCYHDLMLSHTVQDKFKNSKEIFIPEFKKWQKFFGQIPTL